jgi:hypothetical protein
MEGEEDGDVTGQEDRVASVFVDEEREDGEVRVEEDGVVVFGEEDDTLGEDDASLLEGDGVAGVDDSGVGVREPVKSVADEVLGKDNSALLEGDEVAEVEDQGVGVGVNSEVDDALDAEAEKVLLNDGLLLADDDSNDTSLLEDDEVAKVDVSGVGVGLKVEGISEVAGALEENNE